MIYKVDIVCPLYNCENTIVDFNNSILNQKKVKVGKVHYILTKSTDNTEKIMKKNNIQYDLIEKKDFSHSIVRENEAFNSKSNIVVFLTQDVIINDDEFIYKLTKPIYEKKVAATFARQICTNNSIEKYTRELNYPDKSYINSKLDIKDKGLRTFFFSDAASAVDKNIFIKLNGYDQKNLPINEDMYFAYKLITNGYKIKYCSDAQVIHSHKFTLRQIYDRYKLTGKFMKENSYLDKYGTNKTGGGMAKYILKRAIQDKNIKVLINFLPNMAARFIGMKVGKL